MPLQIAFLWHMHQPDYVDAASKTALLPWVRLHATKGYLDMVAMAEKFAGLRVSFNLTPVLIRQIEEQASGAVQDEWARWAAVPADDLDRATKLILLEHFFSAPLETMILPYARYAELWRRRGPNFQADLSDAALSGWSVADWRDLQTWQNLSWFGFTAVLQYPEIAALKNKGRDFSESDKQVVLGCQLEILRGILQRYKRLADEGRVELTTTPFFHPILPLLIDTDIARRAMPTVALPPRFAAPEDAEEQLARAIEQYKRVFGKLPRGLWPSEGSVCPELMPMLQEKGIEWFGSDEEILFRSLGERKREALYRAYAREVSGGRVNAVFRDHELSDFVGFVASRNPAKRAIEAFFGKLGRVRQVTTTAGNQDGIVSVILDGENPWSHFPDGGAAFLEQLYSQLCSSADFVTTNMSDYLTEHPPHEVLTRLHSGSWINADFDIWIGDGEENRAWELLGEARRFLSDKVSSGAIGEREAMAARESLFAAEGSDWFWWYGSDFSVEEDIILDRIFRGHLQNVYRVVGEEPPVALSTPICRADVACIAQLPSGYIEPVIDGRVTSFYEWQGAGKFVVGRHGETTMVSSKNLVRAIYFGFSRERLYLRVDPGEGLWRAGATLCFHFSSPREVTLQVTGSDGGKDSPIVIQGFSHGKIGETVRTSQTAVIGEIIELEVPLAALQFADDSEAALSVQVLDDNIEVARYPSHGWIRFVLPGPQFGLSAWIA